MGAVTSLQQRSIEVPPGGEATCPVLLRNDGTVVDQYTVEVLGDTRAWARADPATINLLPDDEATVVISFQPPRSSEVSAGVVPFGIRVSSREEPAGSVIEEGTLDVGAFTDLRIELVPRKVRGRRRAKCDVAVDNLGNHPVALVIDADDPERALRFRPGRAELSLPPGTTAFAGLTVHPERSFLRGPERTFPFQVRVTGAGVAETTAEGAMVQEPLLPKWLPLALAALIALLVLWFTVIRTSIESAARQAAADQVDEVANTAKQAKKRAEQAAVAAGLPPEPAAGAGGAPGDQAPSSTPAPPGGQPVREPIDFRIAPGPDGAPATADPEEFAFFSYHLPDDKAGSTILVSDLLLQNPFGDSGILRILRVVGEQPETDGAVLLEVGLNNYRDLDYHFLEPWRFKPAERIVLAVNCQNPSDPQDPEPLNNPCHPSASFSGQLESPPPEPGNSSSGG